MQEKNRDMERLEHASPSIFQVAGEPAVCINGLPEVSPDSAASIQMHARNDAEPYGDPCFGGWLEGREVRKLFGDRYYSGKVTNFDLEMNWYRVVYEDGDFEDLEWHELEEVLVPLDISIPLKTLVLQIYKQDKSVSELEGNAVKPRNLHAGNVKTVDKVLEQFPFTQVNITESCEPIPATVPWIQQEASKRQRLSQNKIGNLESACRDDDIDGTAQKDVLRQLGK